MEKSTKYNKKSSRSVRSHRICEICGVRERSLLRPLFFARFPINPDRCKQWVKAVGNEDLIHLPIEKLNTLKRVCGDHFHKNDFFRKSNRLKTKAIPSLKLTAPPLLDCQLTDFPLRISTEANTERLIQPLDNTASIDEEILLDVGQPSVLQDVTDTVEHQHDEDVESPCPSPEVDEKVDEKPHDLPVTCHECHLLVEGHRFVCVSCSGCVVCVSCVTLGVHPTCYVLRVPPHRPLWEVQAVLQAVRSALAMSAFADQLAEPLAGYSIVDIKSESEDHLDLQDEDKVMEAVTGDTLRSVGNDPLAETEPFENKSTILSIKPVPSCTRSVKIGAHESLTCHVESPAESRTVGISYPGPVGVKSEAGAFHINTDAEEKNIVQLSKIVPSKYYEVNKVSSEPKTSVMRVKGVTLPTIRISRDRPMYKVKSSDCNRKPKLSADAVKLLTTLKVLPATRNSDSLINESRSPQKNKIQITKVTSAESQATKRVLASLLENVTSDPES